MDDKEKILDISELGKFVTPDGKKIRSIREDDFDIPQSIDDRNALGRLR